MEEKMRNFLSSLFFVLSLLTTHYSLLISEVKLAPYYNLQITQGASVPSRGRWSFDLNLSNDFGLIAKLNKHSLMGFYQLKYVGPGIKRQEGEQFTDRNMDHLIVFRHHWDTPWDFKLKSQIDYWKQFRRSGTNELWGTGLYDMDRFGGLVGIQKKFGQLRLNGTFQYHSMLFPNYTDLLSELRVSTGGVVESSVGKQDHALTQFGISAEWRKIIVSWDLTLQNYFKQKVISDTVQANGSYYTDKLQQDTITTIKISKDFETRILTVMPEIKYGMRISNQNYQHFDNIMFSTSTGYYPDYYSNSQIAISLPVVLAISKKWETFLSYDYEIKSYANRPIRDADGKFLTEKQNNTMQLASVGFNYKPNPVSKTTFYFAHQRSFSNTKFEKYFPYNYTVASFGVRFSYQY